MPAVATGISGLVASPTPAPSVGTAPARIHMPLSTTLGVYQPSDSSPTEYLFTAPSWSNIFIAPGVD